MLLVVSEIKHYYKNGGDEDFGHQKEGNKNEVRGNSVSLIISCMVLVILLSFVLLTFFSWKKNKDTVTIDETYQTRELYSNIMKVPKESLYEEQEREGDEAQHPADPIAVPLTIKVARLYYLLFLIKRIIMVLIVTLFPGSVFALKI